jgi:hypothetical protein
MERDARHALHFARRAVVRRARVVPRARHAAVVLSVQVFQRRGAGRSRCSRRRSRIASSLLSPPLRRLRDRDSARHQVRWQCPWADVEYYGRDEGDVGVQSCNVWVKRWISAARPPAAVASDSMSCCHVPDSVDIRLTTARKTLARSAITGDVDGIVAARRELCRYRRAADDARGSGDVGATARLSPARTRSLQREPRSRTVFGRRDDVAVVPAERPEYRYFRTLAQPCASYAGLPLGPVATPAGANLRTSCPP